MEAPISEQSETITLSEGMAFSDLDELVGKVFAGKYELIEKIGQGGMSVVYRARHLLIEKIVAIKLLQMHLSKDEVSLKRFKQEAQTASKLNHPGIVTVHDCDEADNEMPYLVMDYVDGKSLTDILQNEGPLKTERFLNLMEQVCSALAFAHKNGVVHRDLKPSNIMVTISNGTEQTKILDFGIAKIISESAEGTQHLTQTGEVFGSPLYMSPEQCSGGSIDRRSDIYSMGCVMYESLSGRAPYHGNSVIETINKHVNDPPPPLVTSEITEETRQRLELILLRCLAKHPGDRYQTMLELESELRTLELKTRPSIIKTLGGAWELASAKRRATKKSRFPLLVTALLTVSVLSLISTLLLTMRLQEADAENQRLQNSRHLLSTLSQAQQSFLDLFEYGRLYCSLTYGATKFSAAKSAEEKAKRNFEHCVTKLNNRFDRMESLIRSDPDFSRKLHLFKDYRAYLQSMVIKLRSTQQEIKRSDGSYIPVKNLTEMTNIFSLLHVNLYNLKILSQLAEDFEERHLGALNHTTMWIRVLSFTSIALSGSVVLALSYYFLRSTQGRLKNLTKYSELLNRPGITGAEADKEESADIDSVLHRLAGALSEAEEREKLLLEKIREQESTGRNPKNAAVPAAPVSQLQAETSSRPVDENAGEKGSNDNNVQKPPES